MRRQAEASTAKVWHGGHRRYFSKNAAICAEARELAKRIMSREHGRFWDQRGQEEFEAVYKKAKAKISALWSKRKPAAPVTPLPTHALPTPAQDGGDKGEK